MLFNDTTATTDFICICGGTYTAANHCPARIHDTELGRVYVFQVKEEFNWKLPDTGVNRTLPTN